MTSVLRTEELQAVYTELHAIAARVREMAGVISGRRGVRAGDVDCFLRVMRTAEQAAMRIERVADRIGVEVPTYD